MKGGKRDRLARLLNVLYILIQYPQGIAPQKIAELCNVDIRTTFRDRRALEQELKVPIWADEGKWGILEGHFLPPIQFNLLEAMTIFIAARLLLSYSNTYNPSIASTLLKLNTIVPPPLREQVGKTMEWMAKQKKDERFLYTLEALARAWLDGRRVTIQYWTLGRKDAVERIIEPYFIQPAALEHANYVIAYCHRTKSVRTFKIERITSVQLLDEHYTVPADFDANKYLGSAWGISVYGETKTVKLKFIPDIARIAMETRWHPSQVTEPQLDGAVVVTLHLPITTEIETFILGWGDKVEVLEPRSLRKKIAETAREILYVYARK